MVGHILLFIGSIVLTIQKAAKFELKTWPRARNFLGSKN